MGKARLELRGAVALVTGASRGIGPVLAEALAHRGADLVLAARNAVELEQVAERLRAHGGRVLAVPTDLAVSAERVELVQRAHAELGGIDLLVNNAGLEQLCFFETLSEEDVARYTEVNLTAPMQLTRLVLPGMQARGRGHVVNIASIAGFGAAAFGETYGATKAGLVGFTRSLRASLKTQGSQVSASALCPGFISQAGMFADIQAAHGVKAPWILGTCTPQAVARALLRVVDRDEPERLIGDRPLRLFFAVGLLFPRLIEQLTLLFGVNAMFLQAARAAEARATAARTLS
jgi:short-subunit dehydrogenase